MTETRSTGQEKDSAVQKVVIAETYRVPVMVFKMM